MATRIVRINPITGEELHYYKAAPSLPPKHQQSQPAQEQNKPNHHRFPRNDSHFIKEPYKQLLTNIEPVSQQETSQTTATVTNTSTVANASSIPLLNFANLNLDESSKAVQHDKTHITHIQNKLRETNPIVSPALQQASARPQSSYRYGFQSSNDHLDSPILAYQQSKLTDVQLFSKPTPAAPRDITKPTDSDLILATLSKPLSEKKNSIYTVERVADLERLWINSSAITERTRLRQDNQDRVNENKQNLLVETILTDQLCDPFNKEAQDLPMRTIYTARGNRFNLVDSRHASHSSLVPSNLTENVLSKRVKFNCRILSPDGKLALRDLFGILFLCDSSLTIYEFRLLCGAYFTQMSGGSGQKANAMPFVQRQKYTHAAGRRKGVNIDVWDLFKGNILYLEHEGTLLEFQITEVDEKEKEEVLVAIELHNKSLSQAEIDQNVSYIRQRLARPLTEIEVNDARILQNVRRFVGEQINERTVEVYMGLMRELKRRGRNSKGLVSKEDLYSAFQAMRVSMHCEDLRIAWEVLDLEGTGLLSYYRVVQEFIGGMSCERQRAFRSLVQKLDTQKTGFVQINDIYKYYKAARHPKVRSGEITENEMYERLLGCFEIENMAKNEDYFYRLSKTQDTKSQLIRYEELESYYNGLSLAVADDKDFSQILKNSWNCF